MNNRDICPNPKCQSHNVVRLNGKAMHPDSRRYTVAAYWNTCLVCWRKWDGVTDKKGAILPAGVEARVTARVRYLVESGWTKPEWSNQRPDIWRDPLDALGEYMLDEAVAVQRGRNPA